MSCGTSSSSGVHATLDHDPGRRAGQMGQHSRLKRLVRFLTRTPILAPPVADSPWRDEGVLEAVRHCPASREARADRSLHRR